MKFVVGENETLKVIDVPDDARPITAADEAVLATREAERAAKEAAHAQRMAEEQERRNMLFEIGALKRELMKTDYQAIKFAEGEMSAADYAPIKAERVAWRARINELEEILNIGDNNNGKD